MANPDDAASWRELADRLAPEQVAELERVERSWQQMAQSRSRYLRNASADGEAQQRQLLSMARRLLVAPPPDATHLESWDEHNQVDGVWFRDFKAGAWRVGAVEVAIEGRQYANGRCKRPITLRLYTSDDVGPGDPLPDHPLTPAGTHKLAEALREAADRVQRYSQDVDVPAGGPSVPDLVYRGFSGVAICDPEIPFGYGWSPAQARELANELNNAATRQSPDPGVYPDPAGSGRWRYFNGTAWTDQYPGPQPRPAPEWG